MKRKSDQKNNKILQIITIPYRALCKVRDFYVNAMIDCANSNSVGLQRSSNMGALPRSFSAASSRSEDKEDFRELIRAASARESIGINVDNHYIKNEMKKMMMVRSGDNDKYGQNNNRLKLRSSSVVMGRIDEDDPSFLGEDDEDLKDRSKFPRSKSHAVARNGVLI